MITAAMAVCAVVLTMCAVAAVVRRLALDVAEARDEAVLLRSRVAELKSVHRHIEASLASLRDGVDRQRRDLEVAHADLMQLFDATGTKRERL